jgi:hypothetical protein
LNLLTLLRLQTRIGTGGNGFHQTKYEHSEEDLAYIIGTGYDYPDLPGLGSNNEKLGLPERLSTGIQFRFRNLFHGKKSGNRNFIC